MTSQGMSNVSDAEGTRLATFFSLARQLTLSWHIDDVQLHNDKVLLWYTEPVKEAGVVGGVGSFIEVLGNGRMIVGRYEGMFEHVTDGVFKVAAMVTFDSKYDAIGYVIQRMSPGFLASSLSKLL